MADRWLWDDVRFFLAVSREGSFSAAARGLGVDHVTVARRNHAAREATRREAAESNARRVRDNPSRPNDPESVRSNGGSGAESREACFGTGQPRRWLVRVTATDALTYRFVIPCIAAIHKTHPGLQNRFAHWASRVMDIARREADLAVRVMFNRPTDSSLVCRKLGDIGFTLYASRAYLAEHGTPKRGHGLGGYDLITFMGAPVSLRSRFFMGESLEGARVLVRSNDQVAQLRATANSLGIIELACFFGDSDSEVTRVWPDEAPTLRPLWLVTHQDLRRSTRIRVVSCAIAEAFQRVGKSLTLWPAAVHESLTMHRGGGGVLNRYCLQLTIHPHVPFNRHPLFAIA